MAEIMENVHETHDMLDKKYTTRGTGNAALTLGIIGTALGALGTGIGGVKGILGGGNGTPCNGSLAEKQWEDYLDVTKQFYEGQFEAYKRDVENRFALYENQRNEDDAIKAEMNSKFFSFYQLEQNDKSSLANRINDVEKKVDIMSAVRPYQDALINCKIDNNALIGAYELQKRTCRMLQGELVLPSSNPVTGFPSYGMFSCQCSSSSSSGVTA